MRRERISARIFAGPVPIYRIHPEGPLARKPNYDFEKRRKEEERRKKKEAKREEREQRKRDERELDPNAPAVPQAD